jgi:molybdenum cofactor cytidylyltransferase
MQNIKKFNAAGQGDIGLEIVGVLLAAGRGTRFGGAAAASKLLAPWRGANGLEQPVALHAARALRSALGRVIAVVRQGEDPEQQRLRLLLQAAGCELLEGPPAGAAEGMGISISRAVAASPDAGGWLLALADMPAVRVQTILAIREAIARGAASAAPVMASRRGHPVGFGAACRESLLALQGEEGARSVLAAWPPQAICVDDPGTVFDIDTPEDLAAAPRDRDIP